MRGCVLRCVWIFICCWFHPVVQRDECIYFFAGIGGSCSLTVMDSLRMFGLSYSSMLMPAWKRNEHKQKKRKERERKREESRTKFIIMLHASFVWCSINSPTQFTSRQPTRFAIRSATRGGKCALTIDARHHHRRQQPLSLAKQQNRLRNLCGCVCMNNLIVNFLC